MRHKIRQLLFIIELFGEVHGAILVPKAGGSSQENGH
jgi:hypothetical protein